jgi:hypothetical protein
LLPSTYARIAVPVALGAVHEAERAGETTLERLGVEGIGCIGEVLLRGLPGGVILVAVM